MVVSFCTRGLILSRSKVLKVPKRNGYIVLVPEIGEDLPPKNPLLKENKTIDFNSVTVEKCVAAISRQSAEFEEVVKDLGTKLEQNQHVDLFKDVLLPLEEQSVSLQTTWSIAKTLYFGSQTLMPTKHYMGLHDRASRASASRYICVPIYRACKELLNKRDAELTDEQRRVLQKFVLEGKLNGLELSEKERDKFVYSWGIAYNKMKEFDYKLQVSTKMFSHTIRDYETVKHFPEDLLKQMATDPTKPFVGPWVVTLHSSVLDQFMEHCADRALRQKVWEADVAKASLSQEKMLQNSSPLEEIRLRKQMKAQYLGYKTYIDLCLETKMAESLESIYSTLNTLLEAARPAQEREIAELTAFANKRGHKQGLEEWDVPYWSRKYQSSTCKHGDEEMKNYLPLPKVLAGLFDLTESLFGVKIVENEEVDVWHQDARYFDVFDLQRSSTVPIGNFYLDPHTKKEGETRFCQDYGYMVPIKSRSKAADTTPLAAMIFNFASPCPDKPALLSLGATEVLFEKFGRLLQHLLTTAEHSEISGNSFVDWDAVMVPDHFMLKWLYEPSVLRQISGHYDTGEPMPLEIIESIRSRRLHFAGYRLCKQLYLSHLDLELHSSTNFWRDIMKRLWSQYFVIPLHPKNSHVCSFATIFSEDWGGAYYSHVWSAMIAADLFSAFEEVPMEDERAIKELGHRYRETFLALGGTYPMGEVFRRFRGRDPSPQALIKNLGLSRNQSEE